MDAEDAHPLESRPPTVDDLVAICGSLNVEGAKYMLVGGLAMIQHGFTRTTQDIDLLVESSLENQKKIKKALEILPDKAIRELGDEDLRNYLVVRVGDEVLVDLMLSACGISYEQACGETDTVTLRGIPIPIAAPVSDVQLESHGLDDGCFAEI